LFEQAGFDGIWFTEGGRTAVPLVHCGGLATTNITIGTGVAVAFPRSPMVTAQVAWELADVTDGRFVLGLGTQVRAHIERPLFVGVRATRSASARLHPIRARDLAAFQGDEKLDYRGEFYNFTMLGDTWTGGPIAHPDIPIYAAAVRPWMLRMCGEVADGVHVHPFHSRRYIDEVVRTSVDEGAMRRPAVRLDHTRRARHVDCRRQRGRARPVAGPGADADRVLRVDADLSGRIRGSWLARHV
jgi:probable F420-dependent oxidoreductase